MSLTDAMREAYADPDIEDVVIDTLELRHPTFDPPIRIVTNADHDMMLGLGSGPLVPFQAVGVSLTLSGFDDDGPTTGQLQIDNVSSMLAPYLKLAVQAGQPIEVVYRAYLADTPGAPGETRAGMFLSKVSLSATSASGTLEAKSKHDFQAFPRLTYSQDKYKALHGA